MTLTEDRSAATGTSAARHAMIVSQLRTSGVNEPWVLEAMAAVPREDYIPAALHDAAYIDRSIPLANGRFLAAPLVHGKMLAEAAPAKTDKVLLVGDGEGYLATLLRPLAGSLDAVDPSAAAGMTGEGGYSLIIVDGAIEELPEALGAQLAEGGRIVTGLVVRGISRLATGCKTAGAVSLLPLAELGIPALPEFAAPKRWSF
ncbi:protein-L-isoaspartate O-methyltransferase family protein [Novosphingobium beihaiensis]|uniref:Protein-L-isoaspartate O-methyltransferase n=1 Tax=Novosphingobium beihaiensis TaxID=2930389 RepID=A0ABT0BRK8_9SPHN|nr:protein-L-isoaspartate O-methyltransferase [Novosphingobium beihaiensis]MCJ2187503.1 protein-L-isoaspartate O-methyltransferase [Novosphingobium beihaiensis]